MNPPRELNGTTANPRGAVSAKKAGNIPSLDGIRAVAVGLVFFAHSGLENIVPGGLGVTIFFVLSGFLITTLMRMEQQSTGAISFGHFYLRRLLRLMPPLLVVVALAATLSSLGVIDGRFTLIGLLSTLFYFGNYFVIAHNFAGMPQGIGVVWSLAVEEHFYLFYPPLAALLLHLNKRLTAVAVLSTVCLGVLAWRSWLAVHGVSADYIGMATDTRIDAILVGCIMALWRNPWLDREEVVQRTTKHAVIIGVVCCAALLGTLIFRDEFFRLSIRYIVQSCAIAPLIYLAVAKANEPLFSWLNNKILIYIGTVSYTIYLVHHMMLALVEKQWPNLGWGLTLLLAALLTLAIAEPMRRYVDRPCAQLRKRLHGQMTSHHALPSHHAPGKLHVANEHHEHGHSLPSIAPMDLAHRDLAHRDLV